MEKEDIGFFSEVQGILENKRKATRFGESGYLEKAKKARASGEKKVKTPKEKTPRVKGAPKEAKPKALLALQSQAIANPCQGCPLEGRPKQIAGTGDLSKAKLLVVVEKITEKDLLEKKYAKLEKFFPIFKQEGYEKDDVYITGLTRSYSDSENLDAVERCSHYLRKEIMQENIKCILILGLRPFQILIDAKRSTVFRARGQVFEVLGKPALVTFSEL